MEAIEESPVIIFDYKPRNPMRRIELEALVESAVQAKPKRKPSISLGELMESNAERKAIEEPKNEESTAGVDNKSQSAAGDPESDSESKDAQLDETELLSNVRITNLTRQRVNPGHTQVRSRAFLPPSHHNEEDSPSSSVKVPSSPREMGYFCDSQLRKHSQWSPGCGMGYFEFYTRRLKRARKQEADLFEEHSEQQKLLKDVYFREREKVRPSVRVDSEAPMVPHLVEALGLMFGREPEKEKGGFEEEEFSDSEDDREIGIRPRRRRQREREREREREERDILGIRGMRPISRRMMTRSRLRTLVEERERETSEHEVDTPAESDADIDVGRLRARTRNRARTRTMLQLDDEQDDSKDPQSREPESQVESSIGAKAGQRRRRNIQRQLSLNGDSAHQGERGGTETEGGEGRPAGGAAGEDLGTGHSSTVGLAQESGLNMNAPHSTPTPGRVVNSETANPEGSRKLKMCYECGRELQSRKKKRRCSDCERAFHIEPCAEIATLETEGDSLCLECFFQRREHEKLNSRQKELRLYTLGKLNRTGFGLVHKYCLDSQSGVVRFEPVEGDEVALVPNMFRAFLRHYAKVLPTGWAGQNLDLLLKASEDMLAVVLDASFFIPRVRSRAEAERFAVEEDLSLFQILRLRLVDSNVNELRARYGLKPLPGVGGCFRKAESKNRSRSDFGSILPPAGP